MLRETLKRQVRAAELLRYENAARTAAEYKEVVDMYNKLDANRERRERYNEISQGDYKLKYTGSKRKGYRLTYIEIREKDKVVDDERTDKPIEITGEQADSPPVIAAKAVQKASPGNAQKKDSSKNYFYSEGAIIPLPLRHTYWQELMRGEFVNYIFDNALEMWQIVGDGQVSRLLRDELTAKQKEALFLSVVRLATTEQIGCYTDKSDRAVRRLIADALKNIREPLAGMIQRRLAENLPVTHEKRCFLEWYGQEKGQIETPGETPDGK